MSTTLLTIPTLATSTSPSPTQTDADQLTQSVVQPPTYRQLHVPPNSNFRAAYYDSQSTTLRIEFNRGGRVYLYYQVPIDLIAEFERAPDCGKFFYDNVRMVFPFEEVS